MKAVFSLGLRSSRLFALIDQFERAGGWWVRACDGATVMAPLLCAPHAVGVRIPSPYRCESL